MYGLADTAGSKSAENTSLPPTVHTNLFRILRGTRLPALSLRWPLSMTCETRAFTSTRSPFFTCFLSSLMRGFTSAIRSSPRRVFSLNSCRSAAAAADRDFDLFARRKERAVVHLGDGGHPLGGGKADAGIRLGDTARRREVESDDPAARIAVGNHQHIGDVGFRRHRALDRHGHRHGVAVFRDLGKIQADATLGRTLAPGELPDQLFGVVCRTGRI